MYHFWGLSSTMAARHQQPSARHALEYTHCWRSFVQGFWMKMVELSFFSPF